MTLYLQIVFQGKKKNNKKKKKKQADNSHEVSSFIFFSQKYKYKTKELRLLQLW